MTTELLSKVNHDLHEVELLKELEEEERTLIMTIDKR